MPGGDLLAQRPAGRSRTEFVRRGLAEGRGIRER